MPPSEEYAQIWRLPGRWSHSPRRRNASVRAVATFHSIGLYWKPEWGAKDRTVSVRYRKIGQDMGAWT